MKIVSKLAYQARKQGLDIDLTDGVKIQNTINKKYVHILPNGKICSDDILGQDKDLKELMVEFLVEDPFSGSVICLPCNVTLFVGNGTREEKITFAKHCLSQCFANIKLFRVVKDETLLLSECRVEHDFALSFRERQAFIDACLEYLN